MQFFRTLKNPSFYECLIKNTRYSFSSENKLAEEFAEQIHFLKSAKNPGAITTISNDVISFRNPPNSQLKYFRIVQGVSDPEVQGLVLSIKESISDALLFGPQKKVNVADEVRSTNNALKIPFTASWSGKILDYLGRDTQNPNETIDAEDFIELFTKPTPRFKKQVPSGQMFTGNIVIDFTDPIPVGSLVYFKGNSNTGKTLIASSTIQQFLTNHYFSKRNPSMKRAIYVNTSNYNTVEKIAKHLTELDVLKNTFLFSNKSGTDRASQDYLLPYTAIAYAQELKRNGYEVLLIIDEIQGHISRESSIYTSAHIPVPPHNIFHQVFEESGFFEQGSLTTIIINDMDNLNADYIPQIENQDKVIATLANVVINFDFSDEEYKRAFPKVSTKISHSTYKFRPYLLNYLSRELAKLLDKVRSHKRLIANKKEHKLTVDPWDHYLYYDSQYFMKLLINSSRYDIIQQIIIVQVVLRSVETETISLFKEEPQVFLEDLFAFAKELKEFEKKDIYTYIETLLKRDLPPKEVTETIVQSINGFYEKFMVWCKVNHKLLETLRDYI